MSACADENFRPPSRTSVEGGDRGTPLPDGSRLSVLGDGTKVERRLDGSKITTWLGEDGEARAVKETLPDGTKITQRLDGTTTELHPDGTKVVCWPDGSSRETRPDGTRIETAPDGTSREVHATGSSTMRTPDGGLVETSADGSQLAVFADGSRVHTKADGSKVTLHKDGTMVESWPDGRKSTTWLDGIRKETLADGQKVRSKLDPEELTSTLKKISLEELGGAFQKVAAEGDRECDLASRPASWRRLPLQLQRLPRRRVLAIVHSLLVLEEAGFSSISADLQGSLPELEGLEEETDYQRLCAWARTPKLWTYMAGKVDPAANCRLWGKTAEEKERLRAEVPQELPPPSPAAPSNAPDAAAVAAALERKRLRGEDLGRRMQQREEERKGHGRAPDFQACFAAWWAAGLQAGRELESMESLDVKAGPRSLGEGPAALFSEAMSPWPELLEPAGRRRRRAAAGAAAAAGAGGPAPPRQRRSWRRPGCDSVWFMPSVGEDFFGERPVVKWPRKEGTRPQASSNARRYQPPRARAAVTLHVGGAGLGIGLAAWARLCEEHGVGARGRPAEDAAESGLLAGSSLHFAEAASGRYVPRAVFADCGGGSLDGVRGAGLFAPAGFVELAEDPLANWAALRNSDGLHCATVLDSVRREMEQADAAHCLAVTHSLQGRTSSALASGLAVALSQDYPKLVRWNLALAPGQKSTELPAKDSFATLLSLWALRSSCSLVTLADNEAAHRLATSRPFGLGLETAGFPEHNGMLGRVLADFTGPMRAGPRANASDGWNSLLPFRAVNNLVPYPSLNLTFAAISPLVPKEMADFAVVNGRTTVLNCLARGALLSGQQRHGGVPESSPRGHFLSTALWCRGLAQAEAVGVVSDCIRPHRRHGRTVDFIPRAFVIGSQPAAACRSGPSAMALRSSTELYRGTTSAWTSFFDEHIGRFDSEGQGLDQAELREAREDMERASADAVELEKSTEEEPQGEEY